FKTEHPVAFAEASKRLTDLQHLVQLSTQTGGRADLCLWNLQKGFQTSPAEMKQIGDRYATLVKQLMEGTVGAKPGTFMVSAQNEPNRTKLSPQQIVNLNLDIDASLKKTLGPQGRKNV